MLRSSKLVCPATLLVFCGMVSWRGAAAEYLNGAACELQPSVDVFIVGAGMAGLKAAQTIKTIAPEISYVLVEGQDRVGGRMRKHTFSGHTIEDGANWIEGAKGNPIFDLALQYDLDIYPQDFWDWQTYSSNGEPIDPSIVASRLDDYRKAFECLEGQADEVWEEHDCEGMTLQDPGAREILRDCGWTPENAVDDTIDWSSIDFEYAMLPKHTSVWAFPEETFHDFDQNRYLVKDERGFEFLAEEFVRREELQPILNTEVHRISWDTATGDPNVPAKVYTIDRNTNKCLIYPAQKVLSTVSIGVLENRKDLFYPPIAESAEVCPYAMATYQKVFFNFTEKFWDDSHDFINIAMENRNDRGACAFWQSLDKGDVPDTPQLDETVPNDALDSDDGGDSGGMISTGIEQANKVGITGLTFDITTDVTDVTVETLKVRIRARKGTQVKVKVFTKTGSSAGAETDPKNWDLVFGDQVISQGPDSYTTLPEALFESVNIQARNTQGWYITIRNKFNRGAKQLVGARGTVAGAEILNKDGVAIKAGHGMMWPFTKIDQIVEFNGAVQYTRKGARRNLKKEEEEEQEQEQEQATNVSQDIFPGSKTLFCTITTEAYNKMGGVNEENAVQFLEPLKKIYGEDKVQHDSVYVPNWTSDPWTFGSYANWKVGNSPDLFYKFFEPRVDSSGRKVIHMGGTASCLRYWEFVHGAWFSGELKALEILADLGVEGMDKKWEQWDHICMQ